MDPASRARKILFTIYKPSNSGPSLLLQWHSYKNLGRKMAARTRKGARTLRRVMSMLLPELACTLTALLLEALAAGGLPPCDKGATL